MSQSFDAPTMLPTPKGRAAGRIPEHVDPYILGSSIALLVIGIFVVYSASAVRSYGIDGDSTFFLGRHLWAVAFGLLLMVAVTRVPTARLSALAYPLLAVAILGLLLVFVPGVGRKVNGALRWLSLGPVAFQPAELAKFAVVVYMAHSLAKKRDMVRSFSVGVLPHVLVAALVILMILAQPDFGTSVIIMSSVGLMLFVAGARMGYLILACLAALPVGIYYISTKAHAWERILVFVNPEAHKNDIGYQIWESLVAFGSGGPWGAGLGQGRQKLYFLPEAHTDFVFSVIGEELGFVGVVIVVALFSILVGRGLWVSARASCRLTRFLAFGLTATIGVQALTNMMVALALLPTKGLTLPLLSFGRSSLVMTLVAIGVLLRVSAEERMQGSSKRSAR